jgi:hypothetical protein
MKMVISADSHANIVGGRTHAPFIHALERSGSPSEETL